VVVRSCPAESCEPVQARIGKKRKMKERTT
jgi:hypothetical protein